MFALVLHLGKLRLREEHSPKATQLVSGRARIQTQSWLSPQVFKTCVHRQRL